MSAYLIFMLYQVDLCWEGFFRRYKKRTIAKSGTISFADLSGIVDAMNVIVSIVVFARSFSSDSSVRDVRTWAQTPYHGASRLQGLHDRL
jgi:hypothetical protein